MKCLSKYKWIKLYRAALPQGKGIMGYWLDLPVGLPFGKERPNTASTQTL